MPVSPLVLVPAAVGQQRPPIFLAQVSASKPPPSSFTSPLFVVEPSRPNVSLMVPSFPALHGGTLPTAGATCVIQRSNDPSEPLRCLHWDGSYTTGPITPLTGAAWITPGLLNSWTQFSGTIVGYLKDPLGFGHLRGRLATTGTSGSIALQLPAGFRPDGSTPRFVVSGVNGSTPTLAFITIDPSGNLSIFYAAGTTDVAINGVTFLAEN